jgi:hypothetical protein
VVLASFMWRPPEPSRRTLASRSTSALEINLGVFERNLIPSTVGTRVSPVIVVHVPDREEHAATARSLAKEDERATSEAEVDERVRPISNEDR